MQPSFNGLLVGKNSREVGKTPGRFGKNSGGWENPGFAHWSNLFKQCGFRARAPSHDCTARAWPCQGPSKRTFHQGSGAHPSRAPVAKVFLILRDSGLDQASSEHPGLSQSFVILLWTRPPQDTQGFPLIGVCGQDQASLGHQGLFLHRCLWPGSSPLKAKNGLYSWAFKARVQATRLTTAFH